MTSSGYPPARTSSGLRGGLTASKGSPPNRTCITPGAVFRRGPPVRPARSLAVSGAAGGAAPAPAGQRPARIVSRRRLSVSMLPTRLSVRGSPVGPGGAIAGPDGQAPASMESRRAVSARSACPMLSAAACRGTWPWAPAGLASQARKRKPTVPTLTCMELRTRRSAPTPRARRSPAPALHQQLVELGLTGCEHASQVGSAQPAPRAASGEARDVVEPPPAGAGEWEEVGERHTPADAHRDEDAGHGQGLVGRRSSSLTRARFGSCTACRIAAATSSDWRMR